MWSEFDLQNFVYRLCVKPTDKCLFNTPHSLCGAIYVHSKWTMSYAKHVLQLPCTIYYLALGNRLLFTVTLQIEFVAPTTVATLFSTISA